MIYLERSSRMSAEGKRRRLVEVDRVTGFAIFLVVVGHIVARQPPSGNEWYVHLKFYIYQFHMPLFMFMSGLVFQYTLDSISTFPEYRNWAVKKIRRLAPGFLLVGTVISLGKYYSGGFIHIDNAQEDLLGSFIRLFIRPTESAAGSLWYIYVLLEFYLLFPLLIIFFRNKSSIIAALVIAMHLAHQFVSLPTVFALHTIFEFGIYFWLGVMSCAHYDRLLSLLRRRGTFFVLLFIASFATTLFLPWKQSQTLIGLASVPALTFLIGTNTGRVGAVFASVSGYTFVIYLLNTLTIGLTKGMMLKLLPWDGTNFYLFFVILMASGLFAPILAQRWVFSRNKTLSRIMN